MTRGEAFSYIFGIGTTGAGSVTASTATDGFELTIGIICMIIGAVCTIVTAWGTIHYKKKTFNLLEKRGDQNGDENSST